ncbi:MAG: hypothetical protein KTR16_16220 [Acidiferrobacterales bacterium]|nr:hypothetical protein [Acidiferrobacterales bacterium]
MSNVYKVSLALIVLCYLSACTTINVDHVQLQENIQVSKGDTMVVLGRHQSAEFETEAKLVSCLGGKLKRVAGGLNVIDQAQFVDSFYPWFEARTAPLHPEKLRGVLDQPKVAQRIEELNIRYFVWVEGSTERTGSSGSIACSISPGGGGCFGFGTWEDTSDYETTIWDIKSFTEVGRISTEAVGTSYMPAIVVPIPLLAQVQGDACQGMGRQLIKFFQDNASN